MPPKTTHLEQDDTRRLIPNRFFEGGEVTHVETNGHAAHAEHAPAPPPTGLRRFTAPGWWRVLWMMPLFWRIGAGLVLLLRWYAGWDPLWE